MLGIGCQDQVIEVQPIKDQFINTEWSVFQTNDINGRPIFKTLRFKKPDIVEIDYRIDKTTLYTPVGEFNYLTQENKIWVKNPDNTIAPGEIVDGKFLFGGETFTRDK